MSISGTLVALLCLTTIVVSQSTTATPTPTPAPTLQTPLSITYSFSGSIVQKIGFNGVYACASTPSKQYGNLDDGLDALSNPVMTTSGLAFDTRRNRVYFSDDMCSTIKYIDRNNSKVYKLAGYGQWQYSGDGGSALSANFKSATGMAYDPVNDLLYVASNENVVRVINVTSGTISLFAGNPYGYATVMGLGGQANQAYIGYRPNGICLDYVRNRVYIMNNHAQLAFMVDRNTNIITKIAGSNLQSGNSGDGGPATSALLHDPYQCQVDMVNNLLYIAGASRIRVINMTSGNISTFAGIGTGVNSGDNGLAINAGFSVNNQFYLDTDYGLMIIPSGNLIKVIDMATNIITTIGGVDNSNANIGDGGLLSNATFAPKAIVLDRSRSIMYFLSGMYLRAANISNIRPPTATLTPTPTPTPTTSTPTPTTTPTPTPTTSTPTPTSVPVAPICFGLNDSNACNGNGKCIGDNNCLCDRNHIIGKKCEINVQSSSSSYIVFDANTNTSSINIDPINAIGASAPVSYSFTGDHISLSSNFTPTETAKKALCLKPNIIVNGVQTYIAFNLPTLLPSRTALEVWLSDVKGQHSVSSSIRQGTGSSQTLELLAGVDNDHQSVTLLANTTYLLLIAVDSTGTFITSQIVDTKNTPLVTSQTYISDNGLINALTQDQFSVCVALSSSSARSIQQATKSLQVDIHYYGTQGIGTTGDLKTNPAPTFLQPQAISGGAIAGAVIGSILGCLLLVVVVVGIVCAIILYRKAQKSVKVNKQSMYDIEMPPRRASAIQIDGVPSPISPEEIYAVEMTRVDDANAPMFYPEVPESQIMEQSVATDSVQTEVTQAPTEPPEESVPIPTQEVQPVAPVQSEEVVLDLTGGERQPEENVPSVTEPEEQTTSDEN